MHQGDYGKKKGVYHINIVDEVLQWEIVGSIEKISEYYPESLLEDLIEQFPFKLINFHSDNGSEFINKVVAKLLNKLLIQQTKSRARHSNDNALAECKRMVPLLESIWAMSIYPRASLKPSINSTSNTSIFTLTFTGLVILSLLLTDKKGKEKKLYKQEDYQTPYQKLKSLENAEQYLKEGISFKNVG